MTLSTTAAPPVCSVWPDATRAPRLGKSEVQVWCVPVDAPGPVRGRMREWLSPAELARSETLSSPRLQQRFLARRAILRGILGRTLAIRPNNVRLGYREKGRPFVEDAPALSFSVSHSGPLALVALAWQCRVGVDIECRRPREDLLRLGERAFSPDEAEVFRACSESTRMDAFYRGWTRKEAMAKALGYGIAASFDRFCVSLAPDTVSRLDRIDLPGETAADWLLRDLEPAPGFAAALVLAHAADLVPSLWSLAVAGDSCVSLFACQPH